MLLCVAILAPAVDASAQDWPARPIKMIVPTGPGTATDVMARLLADGASRGLGQAIIVENMPGASGIIGHQAVARAVPDGYTFLFTNTSGMSINLISFKQLPYDPTRDFTAVAMVCNLGPQMLTVNAELPVRWLPEFVAYARANRGKLSLAYDTTAGAAGFAAKLLNKRADLGLTEIPYRSAAQMGQDIAGGVTQAMMSSIAAANPFIQAGRIRRLAVSSGTRFPGLPDLPSVSETLPGVVMDGFFAIRRAGRHASRNRRAVQSGNRGVSQGVRHPATASFIRPFNQRRRNARKHRAVHSPRAGAVAAVREGA
jgi:tripartite-type tricarboxylate transporter receptor subunit TctC